MGKNGQGPTAAMLVIGDEILSGRTRDSNLHFMAGELTRHGIPMVEARIVTDDHAAKALLDACSQPAFTAGLGASENQDLHE